MNTLKTRRKIKRKFRSERKAVAPVVATMLLVVIMLIIVGIVMRWGIPLIQDNQDETIIRTNQRNMKTLEGNLKTCILHGPGYQLESRFSFVDTEFSVRKDSETWVVYYSYFPSINISYLGLNDDNYNSFNIETAGNVGYPDFDLLNCVAQIDFFDSKPDGVNSTFILNYQGRFQSDVEIRGFLKISIIFNRSVIVSEAWMFPLDVIEQKVHTNNRQYDLGISNGAMLSSYPTEKKVITEPVFTENSVFGSLSLSMIDLDVDGTTQFTSGRYRIGFEVQAVETVSLDDVFNVHIIIDGESAGPWYDYFEKYYDDYKGAHSAYKGFYVPWEKDSISYMYPASTAIEEDNIYPNNLDLRISHYTVRTWLEES